MRIVAVVYNLCNEIEVEQGNFGIKQMKLDEKFAIKDIKSEENIYQIRDEKKVNIFTTSTFFFDKTYIYKVIE